MKVYVFYSKDRNSIYGAIFSFDKRAESFAHTIGHKETRERFYDISREYCVRQLIQSPYFNGDMPNGVYYVMATINKHLTADVLLDIINDLCMKGDVRKYSL